MPTLLVKGVSEETLKQLKRLKVELDCNTWADLLEVLAKPHQEISFDKKKLIEMRRGAKEFLILADSASKKWRVPPAVLTEFRKSRGHD